MTSSNSSTPTLPALVGRYGDLLRNKPNYEAYSQWLHIYHSVAIDGGTLSLQETTNYLGTGLIAAGKPMHHHWMLMDYQLAQQQILNWAVDHEPLNRARLQATAAALMRQTGGPTPTLLGSFDTSQGEFRLGPAMAGSRLFTEARKVPSALDKLVKEINTALPAAKTIRQRYDLSFQAHYQLLAIHPFGEGNGRMARLLMKYIQRYHGLPISLVHVEDRRAYGHALEQSRHPTYLKPLIDFMYAQLTAYLQGVCCDSLS